MDWEKSCNYDRQVSWQGRLDKVLERQKIKLRDNLIRHAGTPEDVLVVQKKTTSNGDTISEVVKSHKIVNCVFPVLKDVPIRQITKEFEKGYTITALVSSYGEGADKGFGSPQKDMTTLEVILPFDAQIDIDDKLIRVMVQDQGNKQQGCSVMIFDVIEVLADFSNNAPLTSKVRIALSTKPVDLDKPLYQLIIAMAKRRLKANF